MVASENRSSRVRLYVVTQSDRGDTKGAFGTQEVATIAQRFPRLEIVVDGQGADLEGLDAVFFWRMDIPQLARAVKASPDVRWVHLSFTGIPPAVQALLDDRPTVLTNGRGTQGPAVGEWIAAMLLAHFRGLRELWDLQNRREWSRTFQVEGLEGKTVGLLGLGTIGRAAATVLRPFDVRLLGLSRSGTPTEEVDEVLPRERLNELLERVDALVIAAPLTPETHGLIGAAELARLRPGAYVLNVGRGEILDEEALIQALRSGHLGGAALDVFEREPLPAESPLWTLSGVSISPHCSANMPSTRRRTFELFAQNVERFLEGRPLLNVIDRVLGY